MFTKIMRKSYIFDQSVFILDMLYNVFFVSNMIFMCSSCQNMMNWLRADVF